MLNFIKKYIYFELLIFLAFLNTQFSLSIICNVVVITYISVLGIIYLFFKYRYSSLERKGKNNFFKDKHVLIIGGSEGIGFSLGKRILKENPKVITLLGRNVNKLKRAKEALLEELVAASDKTCFKNNVKINTFQCDLGRLGDIECAIDKATNCKNKDAEYLQFVSDEQTFSSKDRNTTKNAITEKEKAKRESEETDESNSFTPVDVLICNGAYVCSGEMGTMEHADLINTVYTNICGNINSILKVGNNMKKTKNGLIILINTEAALYPIYGFSFYAMSKSAMWTLMHILDQELKYYNIKVVNAFLPSVNTPGFLKECLTKPPITAEIENMTSTIEPDYAADLVIGEILKGKKFITAELNGFFLSALHAGYRIPETYFDLLIHTSFSGLFIFISLLYKLRIESIIQKHIVIEMQRGKEAKTDKLK